MQIRNLLGQLKAITRVGSGDLLGGGVWLILSAWRKSARREMSDRQLGLIKSNAFDVLCIKPLRWLWRRRDYCKHPIQLLFHLYLLAKYGFKVCLYWFLLFVCLVRFGAHKCVSIYIECELAASRLTKKAEPPPTRGVNRDSGTDSANGGWLRRLVRPHGHFLKP